jgi:hypothetical protein
MLLTALALSHDNLLSVLRGSQVLQRVELSLHSCKVLSVQDITWLPAWQAGSDLRQVLTTIFPVWPSLVEPYFNERVLHIWRDIGSNLFVLRGQLG